MKKVSILLIAMSLFAMMFTGCSSILGEDANATLEDFQGTWYCKTDDNKEVTIAVADKEVNIIGLGEPQKFYGDVIDAVYIAFNPSSKEEINLTVSNPRAYLHVKGNLIRKNFPNQMELVLKKDIDIGSIVNGFIADTSATMQDYIGTFAGTLKNGNEVDFTFGQLKVPTTDGQHLNTVTITGLSNEAASGFVVVAKGVATFTVEISGQSHIFTIFMAKDKKTIIGTATGLTELAGSKTLKLTKK